MIPKIIHYCWFGGNPLPESAKKYIESWRQNCPGYEVKEWNESNFDINCCDYVKTAYKMKKWAFVSDYARFWILYNFGGLYFDTDVEMIRGIEDIVSEGAFMGIECTTTSSTKSILVNPGLGLGAYAGNELYKQILQEYESFSETDTENVPGVSTVENVVTKTTRILKKYGFVEEDKFQKIKDISIYPSDYFCPMDYKTGKITIGERTRTIHHYNATWLGQLDKIIVKIEDSIDKKSSVKKLFGLIILYIIKIVNMIKKVGVKKTLMLVQKKMRG